MSNPTIHPYPPPPPSHLPPSPSHPPSLPLSSHPWGLQLFDLNSPDQSVDQLGQRVCESLANVSKQQLENVKKTFKRLDADFSGRITTEELRQVLLLYQIFILGPTMDALVKRFGAEDGGVLHKPLAKFLSGEHLQTVSASFDIFLIISSNFHSHPCSAAHLSVDQLDDWAQRSTISTFSINRTS